MAALSCAERLGPGSASYTPSGRRAPKDERLLRHRHEPRLRRHLLPEPSPPEMRHLPLRRPDSSRKSHEFRYRESTCPIDEDREITERGRRGRESCAPQTALANRMRETHNRLALTRKELP